MDEGLEAVADGFQGAVRREGRAQEGVEDQVIRERREAHGGRLERGRLRDIDLKLSLNYAI